MNGNVQDEAEVLHVHLSSDVVDMLSNEVQSESDEIELNCTPVIKAEPSISQIRAISEANSLKGVVFMVPPLLAVRQSSSHDRIPVGIDEIKRRIGEPETMSQALLLNFLKLHKDKAKQLRNCLGQCSITELPLRPSVVSTYTKLTESEACNIAEDYFYLASKFMNVRLISDALVKKHGGPEALSKKAVLVRNVLLRMLLEIEKRNSNLDLLTHSFSSHIMRAIFQILTEVLEFHEPQYEDS